MARSPDKITCRHCRKKFGAITYKHLVFIHGYEPEHPIVEYKERYLIPKALCLRGRKKLKRVMKNHWAELGQDWTRLKVVDQIRRRRQARRSLRANRVPDRLYLAGRRFFGTWKAAVEKAGLDYDSITARRRWNRDKIIRHIRELARDHVLLDATHIRRQYCDLFRAAEKEFPKSWAKALRAAGLDPDEHKQRRGRWDRDKAVAWVRTRVKNGRPILGRDAPRDLLDFVRNRLEASWTEFIESLGIPYPGIKKRRDWNKKTVVKEIRRWKAKGNRMNYAALKAGFQALLIQAKKYFKSWDAARKAAGV